MNGRLFCLLAEDFVRIMIVLSSSGNHFLATFPFCQSIMGIFLHDEKIAPALLELHGNDQVVHNVIPRRSLCESGQEVFFELEGKLAIFPKYLFAGFCRWNLSHSSLLSSTCLKIFAMAATIYDKNQSWVVKRTNPTVFMTIIEDKQKQKEDCEKKVQSTPAYIL